MKILKGYQDLIDSRPTDQKVVAELIKDGIVMAGGIDNIVITKNQIIVSDIGCNGRDNSVILRRKGGKI